MKAFARWRLKVWDRRLARYRADWYAAIDRQSADHMHPESLDAVSTDMFWERLVTQAMAKRTTWRKRAGIELRRGGPVRKLSDPGDRPEA